MIPSESSSSNTTSYCRTGSSRTYHRKRRRMSSRNLITRSKDVVTVAASFLMFTSLVKPPILPTAALVVTPRAADMSVRYGRSKTQLRYVQDMEFDFTASSSSATASTNRILPDSYDANDDNTNRHYSTTHGRVEKLRKSMVSSHHRSEEETYAVMSALYAAADGNEDLLSDVVDLLTILVQECEVGMDALIAAAFHYCSTTTTSASSTTTTTEQPHLLPVDSLVSAVVRNAAHLKRTEARASSIFGGIATHNQEVRHQCTEHLRNLLLAETSNWRALVIRCAVHLFQLKKVVHNQHQSETTDRITARTIAKEAMDIYAPLASRLGMHRLKNEIEDAAFQILYKRQYEKVMSLYHRGEMEPILRRIKSKVEHILERNSSLREYASSIVVTSRVKEPFSLWKKMLRSKMPNVYNVPDAIALRIILDAKPQSSEENIEITRARERALCYYVQRVIIEECLPPASGTHHTRRKDYIAKPKKNGYQSLHYTAAAEPYLLEVQIRSGEMHRVAEYGIAAHWDYKLSTKRTASTLDNDSNRGNAFNIKVPGYMNTNDSYLKSVQAWQLAQEKKKQKLSSNADLLLRNNNHSNEANSDNDYMSASEKRAEDRVKPYLEALTTTKFDLEREQVLVFVSPTDTPATKSTPSSPFPSANSITSTPGSAQILSLPYGSCVLDALRAVGKQSGRRSPNCLHNGSLITSETQRLRNGDVLSMMSP